MDIEKEQTALFTKLGIFFAFDDKGFNEKKTKNTIYADLGCGLICPMDNVKQFEKEHAEICEAGRKRHLEQNAPAQIIKAQLENYECYYTGDIDDAVEALEGYNFTREQIQAVFEGREFVA
jgi:hypothetical protein